MTKQKKVFVICPVRIADSATRKKLEAYKKLLESQGYIVHLPHLDTDQKASGYEICMQNMKAILEADEIHIFFDSSSYGSHFDLGVAFLACYRNKKKIIKVIENPEVISKEGQLKFIFVKSFSEMLYTWEQLQNKRLRERKRKWYVMLFGVSGEFFLLHERTDIFYAHLIDPI